MAAKEAARRGIEISWFFDIETENWDSFVLGALIGADGTFEIYDHTKEKIFAKRLISLTGTLWSWNGGRYDTLWLLDHASRLGTKLRVFASSARVTLVQRGDKKERRRGEGLEIRDAAALVPMSLAKAAELGRRSKLPTGFACTCGLSCGGYCRIKRSMSPEDKKTLAVYLRGDCEAGLAALQEVERYARANDMDLRGTIGASSWSTAQRRWKLPKAIWSTRHYKLADAARFGGRTEVFRPTSKKGRRFDINAAYIAALASLELPIGEPHELAGGPAKRALERGDEGVYQVNVTVQPCHVPPLPYRDPKGRVHFPVGSLSGTWTGIELRHAISVGVEIKEIGTALVWKKKSPILRPFSNWIWKLRAATGCKAKDADAYAKSLGTFDKFVGNSLTGKLGQKPEADEIEIGLKEDRIIACPGGKWCSGTYCHPPGSDATKPCCDHHCTGACGRWEPLDREGKIWSKPIWRIAENAHVHWNAYLTAHTRVTLHRQLTADGDGGRSRVYTDTDSLYTEGDAPILDAGPELGQWLHEGAYVDFAALAPKTYRYVDPETGIETVRSKGIPGATWNLLSSGKNCPVDRGVNQFRTGARRGNLFERKKMTRRVNADGVLFGSRTIDGPVTRPTTIEEWDSLLERRWKVLDHGPELNAE